MQRHRKDGNPFKLPARCHYKHGAFWYVHAVGGRWENLGIDIAKAKDRAAHYNDDILTHGSVGWFIDDYLIHFEGLMTLGKKAPRTLVDYKKYSTPIKAYFGKMRPDAVETHHVKTYLDINDKLGRGGRANREKAFLSSAFSWMLGAGKGNIKLNPCAKTGRNKEAPRSRYVSDEEYSVVHALATPNVKLAMELMYKTLQRPSEVLRYRRDAIQFFNSKPIFSFMQGKTKKTMHIEIDDHFQQIIDQGAAAGEYLLVSRLNKHYTTDGIASMLHRYQKIGGIESFGLQDLKVKGATDMYQTGTPIEMICELLGHQSVVTTEIYIQQHMKTIAIPNHEPKKTTLSPGNT